MTSLGRADGGRRGERPETLPRYTRHRSELLPRHALGGSDAVACEPYITELRARLDTALWSPRRRGVVKPPYYKTGRDLVVK